jgi:putative transcriptional regulator
MNPTPDQIREARIKAGLTQSKAAERVHMTLSGWQRAEYGNRKLDLARWELFLIKTNQVNDYE